LCKQRKSKTTYQDNRKKEGAQHVIKDKPRLKRNQRQMSSFRECSSFS
jgi:hypothetical protein